MARCRKLSTDISLDLDVNRLDDFTALMYTWMIPHAEDDCSLPQEPEVIAAKVMPLRQVPPEKVKAAVDTLIAADLLICVDGKLRFEPESFYKYQTYINADKRYSADNSKKQQRTARKGTSLSLSPSIKNPPSSKADDEAFDAFWTAYPRKVGKKAALKAWDKARKEVPAHTIISALKATSFDTREKCRFVPHPATWLNQGRWEDEAVPFDEPAESYEWGVH